MSTPTPQSKSDVDPNFEKQLRKLKTDSQTNGDALQQNEQTQWFRPEGWNGDVWDYDGMHEPFDRQKANSDFVQAIANPNSPGTSGDLIVATTQIDYLACLERAFRVRHAMPAPRLMMHAAGTMKGNGNDQGVFSLCGIEYIRRLVREAKQGG